MSKKTKRKLFECKNFSSETVKVDMDKEILYGVSINTVGEAKGHGLQLDHDFVNDIVKAGNKTGKSGLKVRFGHPNMCATTLGSFLGRAKNFRLSEDKTQALADIFLSSAGDKDMRLHVLEMADKEPDMFGLSIVFTHPEEGGFYRLNKNGGKIFSDNDKFDELDGETYVVLDKLLGVDFVDSPAANDGGLFSSQFHRATLAVQVTEFLDLHPEVIQVLSEQPEIIKQFLIRYQEYKELKEVKTMSDKADALKLADATEEEVEETEAVEGDEGETVVETTVEDGKEGEEPQEAQEQVKATETEPEVEVKVDVAVKSKGKVVPQEPKDEPEEPVATEPVIEEPKTDEEDSETADAEKEKLSSLVEKFGETIAVQIYLNGGDEKDARILQLEHQLKQQPNKTKNVMPVDSTPAPTTNKKRSGLRGLMKGSDKHFED